MSDPGVPLLVTEGEKKALAADQAGFPCVGISGVWSWQERRDRDGDGKARGKRELIDDLSAIAWEGRSVYIAFDSDVSTNPDVQQAEWELAKALTAEGAVVRVLRFPSGPLGAKVGLDDFLLAHGQGGLKKLVKSAVEPTKPSRKPVVDPNASRRGVSPGHVRLVP